MSRKRRMFDIEMPEEGVPDAAPAERAEAPPADRRGPMASAVRENAESLRARADAERAIREENDALAHEFVRARGQGLVMSRIDLGRIRADKLTRDRRDIDQDGLRELMDSIRDLGLSNTWVALIVPSSGTVTWKSPRISRSRPSISTSALSSSSTRRTTGSVLRTACSRGRARRNSSLKMSCRRASHCPSPSSWAVIRSSCLAWFH